MELLLTGEQVTAARAAELGLVNRLVPDGKALDGALALAEVIAANGPLAVAVTKQIARAQADWTVEEGWQRQAETVQAGLRVGRRPRGRRRLRREAGAGLARYLIQISKLILSMDPVRSAGRAMLAGSSGQQIHQLRECSEWL